MEYTSPDEVAVCNLASIALNRFVSDGKFDFKKLYEVTKVVTRNLNKIIDINYYPVPEVRVYVQLIAVKSLTPLLLFSFLFFFPQARKSNFRHRPIGIGVQGLADAFILMRFPFDSPEAKQLNVQIFEAIYHASLTASCELAQHEGPYETYEGSPVSQGQLQYDMWGVTPSDLWDWAALKEKIAQ